MARITMRFVVVALLGLLYGLYERTAAASQASCPSFKVTGKGPRKVKAGNSFPYTLKIAGYNHNPANLTDFTLVVPDSSRLGAVTLSQGKTGGAYVEATGRTIELRSLRADKKYRVKTSVSSVHICLPPFLATLTYIRFCFLFFMFMFEKLKK
jgi:hypothetical protein